MTAERLHESIAMLRILAHAEADFEARRVFTTDEVFAAARKKAAGAKRPARVRKRR